VIVMLANTTGKRTLDLARRFPGKIGHLFSPGAQRGPIPYIPFALDNERFTAFKHGTPWDESKWVKLLEWAKASITQPMWALVPDRVGNKTATLEDWKVYSPVLKAYGWPLAFAVQDGMAVSDVPRDADVIFVGGSTQWKWRTMLMWAREFARVHIGRVNEYRRLWQCHEAGIESVDGTGWMRAGEGRQYRGLVAYLMECCGLKQRSLQCGLFC
jgi:hypothetical protein